MSSSNKTAVVVNEAVGAGRARDILATRSGYLDSCRSRAWSAPTKL